MRAGRLGALVVVVAASLTSLAPVAAPAATPTPCTGATSVAWATRSVVRLGTALSFHVAIANPADTACALFLGAGSPLFGVRDAAGKVVWNSTYVAGRPAPIPLFVYQRILAPGAIYQAQARWDQRTPQGPAPAGAYRLVVLTSGAPPATAALHLGAASGPPAVVLGVSGTLTATARAGATVVILASGGLWVYGPPVITGALAPTVRRAGRSLVVLARATRPGVGIVTTTATPRCYPRCLMASRLLAWRVRVVPESS
ncbi:MAG: hypothetical protein ACP5OV_02080 [Acidimicrobiales bacterium]